MLTAFVKRAHLLTARKLRQSLLIPTYHRLQLGDLGLLVAAFSHLFDHLPQLHKLVVNVDDRLIVLVVLGKAQIPVQSFVLLADDGVTDLTRIFQGDKVVPQLTLNCARFNVDAEYNFSSQRKDAQ